MKRQLTVALGLAVIATPAFATKARLEALGEDTFGSYYIQDNRNIFLNPAKINENKDFITYEFGNSGLQVNATGDSTAAPRAGGGFTKSHGNMVYGLNFGDSSPTTGLIRSLTGANLQEVQPWDFHIGGDAGVKWGASFTYEQYDGAGSGTASRLASHGMRVRGGVLMGDLDLFAQISLKNDAKDFAGSSVKGDNGIFVGGGYMLNNYKLFADYRMVSAKYQGTSTAGSKEDIDLGVLRLGAGRQERLNDRATLFAKAMVTRTTVDDDGGATTGAPGVGAKVTSYALPVNLGIEYAATSWLDLRASVVNNIWSSNEVKVKGGSKTKQNVANTAVRAGASLKFGEFSIDGLVSTDNGTGVASGTDNAGVADASTATGGQLRTDSLMTRVAMIYRF